MNTTSVAGRGQPVRLDSTRLAGRGCKWRKWVGVEERPSGAHTWQFSPLQKGLTVTHLKGFVHLANAPSLSSSPSLFLPHS